jgi:DNA polymerase I-like protein with 3'-5' exonuclease and polymerase domains
MAAHAKGAVPDSVRAAAEHYLGQGYLPVPVPRQGRCKAPVLEGWPGLRPTAADLDRLFPPGPALNLGLLLGAPSRGLTDIDLDCAEAVAAAPLLLPATGWVSGRAGRPRSHWWYLIADPPDQAADEHRDLDGTMLLEVRSTGGQTVVPPSVHESGEPVVWYTKTQPAGVPLADLRAAARAVAAVALLARHWPAKQARQSAYLALAGGLGRAQVAPEWAERFIGALAALTEDEEARKRVQTVAQTARKLEQQKKATGWPKLEELIGVDGKEVVRRARQWLGLAPAPPAQAAPKAAVRRLAPYRPFPVDALPAPIGEYVRQGALALGCDPAYLALPALAVAASVIGNTRAIRLKRGWEEPSIVWSAIVGDSGTLKSPAYLKAVGHLFALQKRLLAEFKEKAAHYQEELQAYKEAKRQAKEDGTHPGDPPEEPVLRRVVCSDTTIEKLAEILEDNPRGTLVARDELAGWLGSFTRYKGNQGSTDLPQWLEMYRAGTVIVDRKTAERRTLFIPRAAVSITGGIQPGVLARALTPEFLDAGLAARLLMALPPKLPKRWSEDEVDPAVEQAYQDALEKLLALEFDLDLGEKVPLVLRLSPEAKAVWVGFYNGWADEQAAAEGELAASFSKLEGYAARLALVHHVVSCVAVEADDRRPVGPRSVEAGISLARWFGHEARRIHATLSETTEERDTRRLVEFIQARGGRITVRGLMRANCRRYPSAEQAEAALAILVEAGLARWIEPPTAMKGGKPIKAVELCMTHDTDDTDPDGGGGGGPGVPDTGDDNDPDPRPAAGPANAEVPKEQQLPPAPASGVIGVMRHAQGEGHDPSRPTGTGPGQARAVSLGGGVMRQPAGGGAPAYLWVRDRAGLDTVATALDNPGLVGLDLETTGLDPRSDRVRLLSLVTETVDGGTFCYLIDCFALDPAPLWEDLAGRELVLHNAAFDLAFLARLGFTPGVEHDTMLLAQLLVAGTNERVSLGACCARYLGRPLDKAAQKSDWAGELTADQLAYAATDAQVLVPLYRALDARVRQAGLEKVAAIEGRCLPAIVWLSRQGVAFDRDRWLDLARQASAEAGRLRGELDQAAPPRPGSLYGEAWNWDSPQQVKEAFALLGIALDKTDDNALAGVAHPLAALVRQYREAGKRGTTYGAGWVADHVAPDGRVYPAWRQLGSVAGRMSCSEPNLQQVPRDRRYRGCFRAPPGRVLVKADYGQLQLRIAAKIAGENRMIEAYRRGEDLHTLTARSLTGKGDVSKEDRQLAKAVNFGLLFGLGARGLRAYAKGHYGLDLTEDQAARYRRAFFAAYPGLAAWHRREGRSRAGECRTLAGRRRLLDEKTPYTHRLNSPVQGTEADGTKTALALLWERRHQAPGTFPVLAVHDEIVVEADASQAGVTAAWLKAAMLDAMAPLIDPVPVEVEVKVAPSWGGD